MAKPDSLMKEMEECANAKCKWSGPDDEKLRRINRQESKKMGVTVNDLVCPKCGNREFYEVDD